MGYLRGAFGSPVQITPSWGLRPQYQKNAHRGKLFLLGVQTACANSFDPSANSFTLKKGIILRNFRDLHQKGVLAGRPATAPSLSALRQHIKRFDNLIVIVANCKSRFRVIKNYLLLCLIISPFIVINTIMQITLFFF
jgi:hypothetical protein